jgi:hypothetical protein
MKTKEIVCILAVFVALNVNAQVSNYLENSSNSCPELIVVKPEIEKQATGSDLNDEEIANAMNMISNAMASNSNKFTIIKAEELKGFEKCSAKVIVGKVKSYFKESARMGQNVGNIVVEILIFENANSNEPKEKYELDAKSGRTWGDSGPFKDAVEKVSKKIKRRLKNG